jgi:hypothetical protein
MTTTTYYNNAGDRINRVAYLQLQAQGARGIHKVTCRRNNILIRVQRPITTTTPSDAVNNEVNTAHEAGNEDTTNAAHESSNEEATAAHEPCNEEVRLTLRVY